MKNIKLIAMTLILVIVIGLGVYLTTGNEKEVAEGEANGKEVAQVVDDEGKQVADVNMVTPFYYNEVFNKSIDERFSLGPIFYRMNGQLITTVAKEGQIEFITVDDEKVMASVNAQVFKMGFMDISSDGYLWNIDIEDNPEVMILEKRDLRGQVLESIKLISSHKIIEKYPEIYIDQLRVHRNHVYIGISNALYIFNVNGELKYELEGVRGFEVAESGDYFVNYGGVEPLKIVGYLKYSIHDGQEIYRKSMDTTIEKMRLSEDESLLILGCYDGKVRALDPLNGYSERVIFEYGRDSSFLKDNQMQIDLAFTKKGDLQVAVVNTDNANINQKYDSKVYGFEKVDGVRPQKEVTLVFTAPYRSDFMLEAIKRYELKYPEEHIKYDYDFNTYEDFVNNSTEYGQKLVLKIINNEIGDVVQTGGSKLDYWPLAQKDVFMDLDEWLKALPYYDDLNHKVLEANRIGGKIRALPTFYNFFQYELNESLADKAGINPTGDVKWSDVMTWIPKLQAVDPSATVFNGRPNGLELDHMLIKILVSNMPDLIDVEGKTANLSQQWFKDLMVQYKDIATYENISNDSQAYDLGDRTQNSLLYSWMPAEYVSDNLHWYSRSLEKKPSKMIPSFVGEKNPNRIAYSSYMYSINQRTETPEKAWQFLSFLISEEIQNTKGRDGAPINKKSLEHRLSDINNPAILENPKIQEDWVKPYYENIEKIDFLNDMAYMKEDLLNEIKRFVNDEITLDEALKTAEQKIMIRLNE